MLTADQRRVAQAQQVPTTAQAEAEPKAVAPSAAVGIGGVSVALPAAPLLISTRALSQQQFGVVLTVPPTLVAEGTSASSNPSGAIIESGHAPCTDSCDLSCPGERSSCLNSLNTDPYNLRSEEFALAECCRGVEIRRMWSETEMVRSFGGNVFPGTPDGMFESWDGTLTCVQVVRVPLILDMNSDEMLDTLAHTVLTKVVKSQQWLRATHIEPFDFIIFCWLPFTIPIGVAQRTESLMERVQVSDSRFSLRLRVPAEAGALFPALFAYANPFSKLKSSSRCRSISESDVTVFTGNEDYSDDDDEACEWDITWEWNADCNAAAGSELQETAETYAEVYITDVHAVFCDDAAMFRNRETFSSTAVWDPGG